MRMSQMFGRTLREVPSDAEVISHQLLLRAGYIRSSGTGIFSYLSLAKRSLTKIENILREEMNKIGGQEICMPVVQPADVWKITGRWHQIGSEMGRFKDKNDHDMVLAMTHEEMVASLVKSEVQSYKDLPRLVYHLQTKWRDDPRPRAGLIRVREFTMKDSYSLDRDWEGLNQQYQAHYEAYFRIFQRCGLPVIAVKSDVGMMGGKEAHEYMYLTPIGEDTLVICSKCGYTANRQVAIFKKPSIEEEEQKPLVKVHTPSVSTIEDLAAYLKIPEAKTAKAVFMMGTFQKEEKEFQRLVFAVIRGDMEVNETKLANLVQAKDLRTATGDEIAAVGATAGFASPIGIRGAIVVVDDLVTISPNLVAGANEPDYHFMNVNYVRDYKADVIGDIAAAEDGFACPVCGNLVKTSRGVEVGNIFKLGTRYTDALNCTFLDNDGINKPVIMGSYGIGVGRLLACAVEEHHDEFGLTLPITIAPYQIHLISMIGGEEKSLELYKQLQSCGLEVLWDDRDERPGVKFKDADLIGVPIRITISSRSLEARGIEYKRRCEAEKTIIPYEGSAQFLIDEVKRLTAEVAG